MHAILIPIPVGYVSYPIEDITLVFRCDQYGALMTWPTIADADEYRKEFAPEGRVIELITESDPAISAQSEQDTVYRMVEEWGTCGPDCPACASGTFCCNY